MKYNDGPNLDQVAYTVGLFLLQRRCSPGKIKTIAIHHIDFIRLYILFFSCTYRLTVLNCFCFPKLVSLKSLIWQFIHAKGYQAPHAFPSQVSIFTDLAYSRAAELPHPMCKKCWTNYFLSLKFSGVFTHPETLGPKPDISFSPISFISQLQTAGLSEERTWLPLCTF